MAKIAILDDRKDLRDTLRKSMQNALSQSFPGWTCCECPILSRPAQYMTWLNDNDIQVLVADQVLCEQGKNVDQRHVKYKGNDVITAIRECSPDYPIFIVTGVESDQDLQEHLADTEEVIDRVEFAKNPVLHLSRMTRAGQRFTEANDGRLARLSQLASSSASGTATKAELAELQGLQQSMALAVTPMEVLSCDEAISDLETEVRCLARLARKIQKAVDQAN